MDPSTGTADHSGLLGMTGGVVHGRLSYVAEIAFY